MADDDDLVMYILVEALLGKPLSIGPLSAAHHVLVLHG
jgi:hypothetical protein